MDLTAIEEKLRDFVAREFLEGDDQSLTLETPLLALGIIDSLRILSLTTFIEEEFGILLETDQLVPENLESLRAIGRMVHARVAAKRDAAP